MEKLAENLQGADVLLFFQISLFVTGVGKRKRLKSDITISRGCFPSRMVNNLTNSSLFQGRKARQKTTRSTTMAQTRNSRGSPVSVYAPYSNTTPTTRARNGSSSAAGQYANYNTYEGPWDPSQGHLLPSKAFSFNEGNDLYTTCTSSEICGFSSLFGLSEHDEEVCGTILLDILLV